ncbi:MAG: hypothetical protein PHW53_00490 [Patescibacteria group bacterium]|nr:hypothetical protein [Patescibacteria group bacterium]
MIFENQPQDTEDIFEKIEPSAPSVGTEMGRPVLRAVAPGAMPPVAPRSSGGARKTIVTILVVTLIAVAAGVGAWYFLIAPSSTPIEVTPAKEEPIITPEEEAEEQAPIVEEGVEETIPAAEEGTGEPVAPVDTDRDGLEDTEEAIAGTNPNLADTDGDGLSDSEEVIIFKTNPLNIDTDGDTYTDKAEVDNGYNPNGEGKLPALPSGL